LEPKLAGLSLTINTQLAPVWLGVLSTFAEAEPVVEPLVSGAEGLEEAFRSAVSNFGERRFEKTPPEAASLLGRIDGDNGQVPRL
jgi:hypothetical protein